MEQLAPRHATGRVYETTRRVRVADADARGRLRLDALARLLQDVGTDDTADAGLDADVFWVARRSVVVADRWPRLGHRLQIATWCGGIGSRWAERRSSLRTGDGAGVEVATLWVHVDGKGRPARLPPAFLELYAEAAGGRQVSSRLQLPDPPEDAGDEPWPVRAVDLDVLGHVNNAVAWAPVEELCARQALVPSGAVLEWRGSLEWNDDVRMLTRGSSVWLTVDGEVRVAAEMRS